MEIKVKISKIKETNFNIRAQKIFEALREDAAIFVELLKVPESTSPPELIEYLKKANKNDFFKWLNAESNFKTAKAKLIKGKIIHKNLEDVSSDASILRDYLKQYFLEFICANVICHIAENPSVGDAIVVRKKSKRLIEKYEQELVLMGRNFELGAEEQLFISLINRLKNSDGSLFNSGKTHPSQARELMTKRLMEGIFQLFTNENVSTILAATISLDITGIFYDPMKQSEAEKLVPKLVKTVRLEKDFLKKTVQELLYESVEI